MSALGALSGKDQFIAKLFYLEIFIWKHRQHFIAQFIVNNKKSAIDQWLLALAVTRLVQIRNHDGSQDIFINGLRTTSIRIPHPLNIIIEWQNARWVRSQTFNQKFNIMTYHQDSNFDPEIKRNEHDQKSKDRFQNGQKRKDNPVSEPLGVIAVGQCSGTTVHALEGHIGGINESDNVHE